MDDKEILNRIREAIACLDEAANYISIESGIARKIHEGAARGRHIPVTGEPAS
jgi:hypothetical protein